MDRRILVIITNLRQASYRLWIEPLPALLARRGIALEVQLRPRGLMARRRLLRRARDYDGVVLFRKLLDPSDARLLRRNARRVFFALDDAVMFHAHPVGRLSQWRTARRFEATARIVDHVIAGNEYLADFFRDRGRRVTVLPAYLDPAKYEIKNNASKDGVVTLVWIGSKSTLPYLADALPAIRAAAAKTPLKLLTIADAAIEGPHAPNLTIEHVPWSAEVESRALAQGDIGIAPTPDDRWTRGKCGFKILQYMAAGLPTIASPVGANSQIIVPEETGLLASTPEQWRQSVEMLAGNTKLRRQMGSAAHARVESHYTLEHAVEVWAKVLSA